MVKNGVDTFTFFYDRRRVVVPLARLSALTSNVAAPLERINPIFMVEGVQVVLHTLDMVSVAMDQLGPFVGTLAD